MHSRFCRPVTASAGHPNSFRMGLILLLAAAMLGTPFFSAFAQATSQSPDPAAVESEVKKFGVGKSVKVWLVGGEQVNGHIRKIGDDSFTVKVNKSTERAIPYAQVREVKDPPGPLEWLLIGAAIVLVTVLIVHH